MRAESGNSTELYVTFNKCAPLITPPIEKPAAKDIMNAQIALMTELLSQLNEVVRDVLCVHHHFNQDLRADDLTIATRYDPDDGFTDIYAAPADENMSIEDWVIMRGRLNIFLQQLMNAAPENCTIKANDGASKRFVLFSCEHDDMYETLNKIVQDTNLEQSKSHLYMASHLLGRMGDGNTPFAPAHKLN